MRSSWPARRLLEPEVAGSHRGRWARVLATVAVALITLDSFLQYFAHHLTLSRLIFHLSGDVALMCLIWSVWAGLVGVALAMVVAIALGAPLVVYVVVPLVGARCVWGPERAKTAFALVLIGFAAVSFLRSSSSLHYWLVPLVGGAGWLLGGAVRLVAEVLLAQIRRPLAVEELVGEARHLERARITRRLHDGLGAELAFLRLLAQEASVEEGGDVVAEIAATTETAQRMLSSLVLESAQAWNVDCLDDQGTPVPSRVLGRCKVRLERVGFPVRVGPGIQALDATPPDQRELICSFFLEATTNVLKHAGRGMVEFEVTTGAGVERVSVCSSDGLRPVTPTPGTGLTALCNVAAPLGWRLDTTSRTGRWCVALVAEGVEEP